MNTQRSHQLGTQLMEKHGLIDRGWKLRIDRRLRRLEGCCKLENLDGPIVRKLVVISAKYVEANSECSVRNLILHEIAHALTFSSTPEHGRAWRRVAQRIGVRESFLP